MYQILIADDEVNVISSLTATVPWDFLDLQVAASAQSADAVFQIVASQHIDIIITDIKMPGISGLDMCNMISKQYPHIQFILISGYADFSYAQKAIEYGVLGYCLKPVDPSDLCVYLKKASLNLDAFNKTSSVSSLVNILVDDSVSEEEISHTLTLCGLNAKNFYLALSIGSTDIGINISSKATLSVGKGKYCYFMDSPLSIVLAKEQLQSEHLLGISFMTDIPPLSHLSEEIERLQVLAYHFWIAGVSEVNTANAKDDRILLSKLHEILSSKDDLRIIGFLNSILIKHPDISIKCAQQICNQINSYLMQTVADHDFDDSYIYSFDQLTAAYKNLDDMCAALITQLNNPIIENTVNFDSSNTNFLRIAKYINRNYTSDISLMTVADALDLNPSYVSQLFKKESGSTYTKYLTNMRIEKAKELLTSTNMTLNEISDSVGFNDYFYFLKTFKKFTGVTPGKYISVQ